MDRPRSNHEFVCTECGLQFVAPYDDAEFALLKIHGDGFPRDLCDSCWKLFLRSQAKTLRFDLVRGR